MTKRIDWDRFAREQRVKQQGAEYAYDELPHVGSRADKARYLSSEQEKAPPNPRGRKRRTKPSRRRLLSIKKMDELQYLLALAATPKWRRKDREQKRLLLTQVSRIVNLLLKLYRSNRRDRCCVEANQLLAQNSWYFGRMNPQSDAPQLVGSAGVSTTGRMQMSTEAQPLRTQDAMRKPSPR